MTILLVNMWHKLQLASVCKLYCLLPALPEVRSLWPTPRYSWPQQACPRDGGRPGDAQVQSAIAEKHVYCVKNLLALPCLTSIWYSIYMYLPHLGKPVLIWENNIWTSGFWFWFSDVFWILFIVFWSLCLCLSVFLSFRLFVLVNIYEFILVHN